MTIALIRAALETRLLALSPALPTALENALIDPAGAAHQRAYLLPNTTKTPGFDLITKHEKGIFQVSVCYPLHQGSGACAARAELIRAQFNAGLRLTQGGITVLIYEWPSIGRAMPEDAYFVIPVSISYRSFTS